MEASIAAVALDTDARAAGVEASPSSALSWLARCEDNWLLIMDGADVGYELVEKFMPAGKNGNILISTRNVNMSRLSYPSDAYMEVTELDDDAAITLFLKSAKLETPSPAEAAHAIAIIQELSCLALAVDQAASAVASGVCRVDEYLGLYKRRRVQLMDDDMFKGSSNYGHAVYTTWDISFAELERRACAKQPNSLSYQAAIFLLRVFSFFHFDGIVEDIFRFAAETPAADAAPSDSSTPLSHLLQLSVDGDWDPYDFRIAMRILTQFSLIKSDGLSAYSIHRLVHQWAQDRLPKSCRCAVALSAAEILARSVHRGCAADDYRHRRGLLVHLMTLFPYLNQDQVVDQLSAGVMQGLARIYQEGGKWGEAEALLCRAVHLLESDRKDCKERSIDLLEDLAWVQVLLEKFEEAEPLNQRVLKWRTEHLGLDDALTISAMGNLAVALHKLRRLEEARELEVRVLQWRKDHFRDHPHVYMAMGNLASTLFQLERFTEAKELYCEVLVWRKVHLGNHPDTYVTMANLAQALFQLGQLAEAIDMISHVLEWRKEYLGADHPDTVFASEYLAMVSEAQAKKDAAPLARVLSQERWLLEKPQLTYATLDACRSEWGKDYSWR
jgi:tetratricopeptide (TPR) repeat protein